MTPKKRSASTRARKGRLSAETLLKRLHSVEAKSWYVVIAGFVVMVVLFFIAITPERYDLKVGDIAYTTITASKDVVDEIATKRNRDDAARQVEPTYLYKEGVTAEVMHDLTSILTQANTVQQYGQKTLEQHAPRRPAETEIVYFYHSRGGICQIAHDPCFACGLSDQYPVAGKRPGNARLE